MKRKGVTLIELIAVIAIVSVFSIVIYSINSSGQKIYTKASVEIQIQNSVRNAINEMTSTVDNARFVNTDKSTINTSYFTTLLASDRILAYIESEEGNDKFLYVLRNGAIYKLYSTSDQDKLVCRNVDGSTAFDSPLTGQEYKTIRMKIVINYGGETQSFVTLASIREV